MVALKWLKEGHVINTLSYCEGCTHSVCLLANSEHSWVSGNCRIVCCWVHSGHCNSTWILLNYIYCSQTDIPHFILSSSFKRVFVGLYGSKYILAGMDYTSHKTTYTTDTTLVLSVIFCMSVGCMFYVTAQERVMYTGTQKPDSLLTVLALLNQPYCNCMSAIQSAAQRNMDTVWVWWE